MRLSHLNVRNKSVVAVFLAVAIASYVLYTTGGYVAAYRETKVAHVFPTIATAQGWEHPTGALAQELGNTAPYASFTPANSAFISIAAHTPVVETPMASSTLEVPDEATSTPPLEEQTPPDSTETTTEEPVQAPQSNAPTPSEDASSSDTPAESETSVPDSVEEPIAEPESQPTPAPAPAETQETSGVSNALQHFVDALIPKVYATTTDATTTLETSSPDTPAFTDDVPTCFLQQKECHTITLGGFAVTGEITDTTFKKATLNFSFGANVRETELIDDKISVRYYHAGTWREVGEIYLNKEFSNGSNGGYFSAALDEVDSWEGLSDVQVVIEYERNNDSAVELYLDAVWIATDYRELLADVVSGETNVPTLPTNVVTELRSGGSVGALALADGTVVTFPYTDDLGDTLMIRTDKASYSHAGETVYASITNTGSVTDSVHLYAAFPRGFGSVKSIEELKKNVPTSTETPTYQEVTFLCESGWVDGTATSTQSAASSTAATSTAHVCPQTGESHVCSALNADKTNCSVSQVQTGTASSVTYTSEWVQFTYADSQDTQSLIASFLPPQYKALAQTDDTIDILPGQTVYVRLVLESTQKDVLQFALLAKGQSLSGMVNSELLKEETVLKGEESTTKTARIKGNTRMFGRAEFDGDELPQFKFQFKSKRNVVSRGINVLLGRGNEFAVRDVSFKRDDESEVTIPVSVEYGEDGQWMLEIKTHPRSFRPGKYSADITMQEGADEFTERVEFYWGVLAMNTNQSSYAPGETVPIALAALDDLGNTICDADLHLTVTTPSGASSEVPVVMSGRCENNNVVDVADYLATYTAGESGVYNTALTEYDSEMRIVHRVYDSFVVRESAPFIIRRAGMTRIYPIASYTMDLELTAANDFEGEFAESVPVEFEILDAQGAESRAYGGAKNLVWPVKLIAGQTMKVSYTYNAPDISPYMYLLGPAKVQDGVSQPFEEPRQWKLASDAVSNMLIYWDSTYIPTGWTCVSCLPADSFYQRFVMGSSTAGVNGGSATVTHTATGAVLPSSDSTGVDNNNVATPAVAHSHTYSPTIGSAANLPPYRNLVILQYTTTGEPASLPTGAIAFFDGSLPAGWSTYSAQNGYFIRGESTSTVGTTGGAVTHSHSISGSTGAAVTTTNARNPGTTVSVAATNHTHGVTGTTDTVSNEPPYMEAILGKLSATSSATNNMITMWTGNVPTTWQTVSSSTDAFSNAFVKASSTPGNTGGAFTHTHADVLGLTTGAPSATVNRDAVPADISVSSNAHTHTVNVTAFTSGSNLPPYRTAIIAKRTGGAPPDAPMLYDVLFDNERTGTSTPAFEFSATDTAGTDSIVYEFQWDDDSDLDSSPLGDRTSDVETGCSPNCFQNLTTPVNNSPFTEADRIRFTIQTPLVSGTTYYWRVRAKKSGGALYGAWATTTSFTYRSGISPSQWLQTTDAQFDTNTLSGVETFGSDAARLAIAPSQEALVAYGEGVVQTPRYRIWNGSAWSAESSANSVGGTIQWVVTKASPTRDEYVMGTQDASSDVNVQIFNGTTDTWGSVTEMTTTVSNAARRGFSLAYEQVSGDIMVVYCDGNADPSYRVWNGSSWSAAQTINITSANNCEWIQLASDPVSDEIILVERDTGAAYEAQVWDGSAWGNSKILGSMADVAHEGIGVTYEESGDQALVTVSNGFTSGFVWTSWNGSSWGITQTQTLGDDFEWGRLRRDVGTDRISLCYIDQDADIGTLLWDGNAWDAFTSAGDERDTGGNLFDGRASDCQFETTTGRDGYLMLAYSDTMNARYQYWNGTSWAAEATISTIQDSWTVNTVRTSVGQILAFFHDDVNTQYDVSDWNGTSWSAATTLETSPSVTVAPFLQPIDMAAQEYESSSGTMTGTTIDFDQVSGRQTWGEVLWHTTEPSGTDIKVQVLYDNGTGCTTLVPNGTLPGNSIGFDATSSPLNISALSTSTYNRICLRANYTTATVNAPQLDDWSVSWVRQPYLTQTHFSWYANNTTSLTPTDPWPSGGTDLAEDSPIPVTYAPAPNDVVRLRMSVLTENVSLSASSLLLKLQYAAGESCSASLSWYDVGAVGSTTALWRGYDNAALSDGATLPTLVLSTTASKESYEEANDSVSNPNTVAVGNEGEWDWVIQHNAPGNTNYCFRVVSEGDATLNEYDLYPSLITNSAPGAPTLEAPFDNEALASTTPWFQFVAEDPESDDITYQIQIDDDSSFGSVNIDRDSQNNFDEFTNLVTPSDKDPYTPAQSVQFVPTSALSNGTTYYWRVRGKDRTKSGEWSSWSEVQSVTIDTSVTISTWRQTTQYQFDTDDFEDAEATSTNDVVITPGFTNATTSSTLIDFDWHTTGNAWGSLTFTDTETSSDIHYHIEYFDSDAWNLVPDADLPGNTVGYDSGTISMLSMSPTIYNQIRIRADMTNSGATPRLQDWSIVWGYAVEQPVVTALFDNEKTPTTTPTFTFKSSDPQNDDLMYEVSISTTQDFTSSTTRRSSINAGFTNVASSTDTSPFTHNAYVNFKLQAADALTNGTTYWWKVRAIDPTGGNVWSVWSDLRSFTVDTSVSVSTWFQTTNEQFLSDTLSNIETGGGSAQITSTISEAFMVYAEGTVQVPRFRLWNGTAWGTELSGVSVGDTIRFAEAAASPARDEYMIMTEGSTGVVDVQVVDGATDTAGNSARLNTVSDPTQRGFDIAYETNSGDALAVSCYGTEATYRVWNGSAWTASSTISLAVSTNCEWVKLASDPTSDEIIMVVRDATTGATDYQSLVWNGSSWGNSMTMGSQITVANEGIAVEYEESGNQALVIVSNGANGNFLWNSWNGSAWSGTNTVTLGDDFESGRLARDAGSDNMAFCYVDVDSDIGYVLWNGSSWGAFNEMTTTGNSVNNRPVSCEYETLGSRDGYVMFPYSDTIQVFTRSWNGSALSGATGLSTITDSSEVRTARTGNGLILLLAYDDANTEYDFSYWNGSAWSTEQQIEATSITTVTPPTIPMDIVARLYPSFTAGTIESSTITFSEGSGPKWGSISFSKTTPGASTVKLHLYYLTSSSSWAIIPDSALPGNVAGTTTSPVNISNVNRITYSTIRMVADLDCVAGDCPTLNDWTLNWSAGINVQGTVKQYNQSTNVTSGTVAIAVNGVLQSGKTATITGSGTFSIPNVTAFQDDIVTVFIDGAAETNEGVAVTKYDGEGDITGVELFEHHFSIGSDDNATLTNADIALYDNSVSGDEDIFYDVDAGNDLSTCVTASGSCGNIEMIIKASNAYRPDSASSGNVSAYGLENNGTFTADGNTISLSGSWDNNATFNKDSSTVIFTATTSTQTVDSSGAILGTFNNVTFGSGSGSATWTLGSTLDIDGALTVNFGTLSPGAREITIGGNLTFGASGVFRKGATTTFDGTTSSTWTDNTASKQDLGTTTIDGTNKTVLLGSNVKATNITIGADDTLSANNNYNIEVTGSWTNNNIFIAQSGTVTFSATSTGKTIVPGSSSFYNVVFNGTGGNWQFNGALGVNNDFTITSGTVNMPFATTTISGSFSNSGSFVHNNGGILFNSANAGKTITTGSSAFYDVTFSGAGSWSFGSASATSSRNTIITQGTVTLPSGTYAVGGVFWKSGGSFAHNGGTVKFTASNAQTIQFAGTSVHNITFAGPGGSWSFLDASITANNTVRFENGTTTLPSGTFSVGGSWTNIGAPVTAGSGTVSFVATSTGRTIAAATSSFATVVFNGVGGGWTISQNATSSSALSITNANSFTVSSGVTLAVGGTFTNSIGGATTTWTGSTLSLYSGTAYTLNTKTAGGDVYGTLSIGANTDVRMWNSSTTIATVNSTGSLYSQDNNAVDGALYIWGEFVGGANEYWSYATDFDGTALGGSSRPVNVRIATSSTLSFSVGTLAIVGAPSATTTIQNQGTGRYSLAVSGGTLNAQYYSFKNMSPAGVSISGTTAVTSLANGDYELGVNGGTMLTIASTVIDANALLQIQQVKFATSTGITSGANVTETGTPGSYWWFRNHYGNYAGENFDVDPGGNPGHVRWDDSSLSITVSGHVYSDNGSTAIGNPPCDGSTARVKIVVNGGSSYTGSCNAGTGAYSISGVGIVGDAVITAFLDTNGGKRAVTITRTPTTDIANFDLYENTVIVRHEDVTPITITQLAVYDSTKDSDVPFTAATSSSPSTLTLRPDTQLYVWAGKTFTPGGNVTLQSGGSGSAKDGRLMLATSSAFLATGSESHAIGGGLSVASGATFTTASSTFTFTATTSGKVLLSTVGISFYNLTFNGSGAQWALNSTATTTVTNSFAMTTGTLTGTGDMHVSSGSATGAGTIAMSGGTFQVSGTGSIGSASSWTFNNLILGSGSTATTSKTGVGTTTITGILRVTSGQTLNASSTNWVLSGGGTPFVVNGTFNVESAPFFFTSNASTTIADATYAVLRFAPVSVGTPVYALRGGTLSATQVIVGGTNPVYIDADLNDPSLNVSGSVTIGSGSTVKASNTGAFDIGGSWSNAGTFVSSGGTVNFNSTDTGETIDPGSSAFGALSFNSASGGWTILQNATSSSDFSLTNAASFTLSPNRTLAVGGTFTNGVGGSATTWATSTLYLYSGTSFTANTKSSGADSYGTLDIAANTDVRMWNSSAATTTVNSTGSLYSQNHAGVSGNLYIWGEYVRTSGDDYWSYATDFDGATTSRAVSVRIATSSTLSFTGGGLEILGTASATTTIANQGTGRYAFSVSGGTLNAQYYQIRDTNQNGLALSGSPTITTLSDGDYQLNVAGGTMLTVAGTVIDANPLKIFARNTFATSTGIASGYNVVATGSSGSSWKFNLHYGNYDGEVLDSDPAGDPGYIRWDDSASNITIAGNVYSDEGNTVSTVCDNTTQVVRLKVQGAGSYTSACNSSTGAYSIPGVAFNPGDTVTVYLDTAGGRRAASVSIDPISSISNMHLYENRVIVRHEDVNPITIAAMAQYDSDQDTDIPFNATDAATDTLVVVPNTKLIVFTGKTFTPGGNMTLQSGGLSNAYDGTLEIATSSTLTVGTNQSHVIGGSLIVDSSATLTSASSTFTFTATTTGKTITLNGSSLYNVVFNGTGGNWAFNGTTMTTTNDFTITSGTVTLPSATSTIGGSFQNVGGAFQHNNGTVLLAATTTGKSVRVNGSSFYTLSFNGAGGAWTFVDSIATSSNNFIISAGTVTAPSAQLTVGGSFQNAGTFTSGISTLKLVANSTGKTIETGGSTLYNVIVDGVGGGWTFSDTNATVTRDFSVLHGTTTLPTGTLTVGGSWATSGGGFTAGAGTVALNATTTGKTIDPGISSFNNISFNSSVGGWTILQNATTTGNMTLTAATAFTLTSNKTLAVGGAFTNGVGGSATTWSTTTLSLYSGTSYSINTKSVGGDVYGTLLVGTSTDVRMWNSTAATTTVDTTGSLYSQDNAALSGTPVDGDLYIWGEYVLGSGSDYWSYATDFDGTALGGSSRQVNVKIATSSSVTVSGGTLEILGSSATTTIANQGTGRYAFNVTGGTLNASHYQFRNTDPNGLNFSGTPSITSLDYGDLQLQVNGGSMITVTNAVVDANASKQISYISFATSSGITSGFNVKLTGTPTAAWTFLSHNGNYAGESYDSDGIDACGNIRWSDSSCLFVNQGHYRWRQDDGGVGAPNTEWYSASWSKRKKIMVSNPTASVMTNQAVKIIVDYDADMQTDFEDLRFTDSSGTTTIPYWIESSSASASSTVWVKLASIPASGSANIYMYYGNAGVSDGGDGSSTFTFFDDFEDGNISEYSGSNASLFNVGTAFNHNYTYGLDAAGSTDQRTTAGGIYRTGSLIPRDSTIRFFEYMDATAEDEPCTFFGVQSSGNNYAVCLDQYPSEKVSVMKNVTSNDGSGISIASTSVTFATGWYEVVVNWLTTNAINVSVYDSTGALFATVNTSDSSYTSGGMGFGFWFQNGGWDFYSVRPYVTAEPTYVFGAEQVSGGASWLAAEDTAVTGVSTGENLRLRFTIQNSGAPIVAEQYKLQIAQKGAALNCESVAHNTYSDVPATTGGCGGAAACMTSSTQFTDQTQISDLLSRPASMSFAQGRISEDPSIQTSALNVGTTQATEVEYNFQLTTNAVANAYCFRTAKTSASTDNYSIDNYDHVAEVVLAYPPIISNFNFPLSYITGGISLTEGTSTTISATGTVTDLNGYTDIVSATSSIFRSGVGGTCTSNVNNCYPVPSCTLSNCAGSSCTVTCSADVQYLADPTDAVSANSAEAWLANLRIQDASGLSATAQATGADMNTLYGLTVTTPPIDFGSLSIGENTGATTSISTIANTGNAPIDIDIAGTDLVGPSGPSGAIPVGQQAYATSTFNYGSCSVCQFLTGSATHLEVDLPKPTATSTTVSDDLYWGINVPVGVAAETHTGTNTFIATTDN